MRLRGYRSPLLLVALFCLFLKAINHLLKMTIISDTAKVVYSLLIKNGFDSEQAKLIVAQAAHETNNFSSRIFRENNNLFGMKLAVIRPTLATGQNRGHATFKSVSDSINDFMLYHKARALAPSFSSVTSYIDTLHKKNYFEADKEQYLNGVKLYYNMYFTNG